MKRSSCASGSGIRALVLDGVLGGDHHERRAQGVGLGIDRDLPLLHAFEEGGLGLRGGAVDLVAEHDVREHGTGLELEVAVLLVEDVHPGDVRGEHVGRELDPPERAVDRARDRFREHRLADARHILDEQVSLRDEGDESQADLVVLATERHVLRWLSTSPKRAANAPSSRSRSSWSTSTSLEPSHGTAAADIRSTSQRRSRGVSAQRVVVPIPVWRRLTAPVR